MIKLSTLLVLLFIFAGVNILKQRELLIRLAVS